MLGANVDRLDPLDPLDQVDHKARPDNEVNLEHRENRDHVVKMDHLELRAKLDPAVSQLRTSENSFIMILNRYICKRVAFQKL